MVFLKKIDCHTHIVNRDICQEYFARTDSYAITMEFLEKFEVDGMTHDVRGTVLGEDRLFFSPCIDISSDIPTQLEAIEPVIDKYRVVGLKVYLTYQAGRADDTRMMPIYDFARKHRLTITYHTGSCALTLASDNDLEGSNAAYVQNVAKKYPDVKNFTVEHLNDYQNKEQPESDSKDDAKTIAA